MYDIVSITSDSRGSLTQADSIIAKTNRAVSTFEVLEYDNNTDGDYALAYKDISIQHEQSNIIERANTPYEGGVYIQLYYNNGELPDSATELHNISQTLVSNGTRLVTYKLHCKIKGRKDGKEDKIFTLDLASMESSNIGANQAAKGQRIYGVSIQVSDEFIVYSYEVGDCLFDGSPLGYGPGFNYDSPINIEDWNYNQLGAALWKRSAHVVGVIDIYASSASDTVQHTSKAYEVLPVAQYSVGIVEGKTTIKESQ